MLLWDQSVAILRESIFAWGMSTLFSAAQEHSESQ